MKTERSEYVSIWVTPEVKKEFEFVKDNREMQEDILRRYIKNEVDFLRTEMNEIDDYTIKYKAKLIGIKDSFSEAQDMYVEELEKMYIKVNDTLNKVNNKTKEVQSFIAGVTTQINILNKGLETVSTHKLDSLLNTIDRYSNLSDVEKELLKQLL